MKILMLCPMLSSSSMITVYPTAKALSKRHEVKLLGPTMGGRMYIHDLDMDIEFVEPAIRRPVQAAMLSLYPINMLRVMREEFDVVHAFKMLPHTAPVASMAKMLKGKKFVLTIDDYDSAASSNPLKNAIMKCAERSFRNADKIIVSSRYLQSIFGGNILYQVPNERLFSKKKYSSEYTKKRLGLGNKKMVFYAGTFYDHKGLDVLIKAVQSLGRDDVRLVLAGGGGCEKKLRRIAESETLFTGKLPMEQIPELTAAADVYAIPTINTEYARAEVPGKIFEPMMLGRPIVASRISDIPDILEGGKCGFLAEPGNAVELAHLIERVLDNPGEAKRIGKMARERFFSMYSMKYFEKKVNTIYENLGD